MKKKLLFTTALFMSMAAGIHSQTTSTFENLNLPADTFWNGSDQSGGFASGNAFYPNFWDTSFGGYWSTGWALSTKYDTAVGASNFMTQLYSCKEDSAYMSKTFAIATYGANIQLTGNALGKVISGFYITNTTYAYNSMTFGDFFGKKFGGTTGNDPDWFKVIIHKYYQGSLVTNDSVEFYLADFRFGNNSQDYIVDSWTWVDLTTLGNCDSLQFSFASSDNNSSGMMNTPAYFCMDNFTTADSPLSISSVDAEKFVAYPIPTSGEITISTNLSSGIILLKDIFGKLVLEKNVTQHHEILDLSSLQAGTYVVELISGNAISRKKIIKQ